MKNKKFWSLLLILCLTFAFSASAMAASAGDVFKLNVTSADSYRGYSGTKYNVSGVDVTFATRSNSNTDDYGTLYIFTKSGTTPVELNISVYLNGHEETRQSVKVTTVPNEYVVLELNVNMANLVSRYGKGEDLYSSGDGWHYFYFDVYDAAGNRIAYDSESATSKLNFVAHISNAYEVQKPADPRDTPEVFSFTDSYDSMGGQWLYAGGSAYAYRCYFTLVTGADAGSYSMTFPYSENAADVQSFSVDANSVYKLTYTYPLAASMASYKYSGTIPWSGPKGTKGSFALSFSGGKVSKGNLTVEKMSGAASGTPAAPAEDVKPAASGKAIVLTLGSAKAKIDGAEVTMDVVPEVVSINGAGVTFVPVRFVTENLGLTNIWSADAPNDVVLKGEGFEGKIIIGSVNATINGAAKTLLAAPYISNNRTMVPLRFLSESLGYSVNFDSAAQTITIK